MDFNEDGKMVFKPNGPWRIKPNGKAPIGSEVKAIREGMGATPQRLTGKVERRSKQAYVEDATSPEMPVRSMQADQTERRDSVEGSVSDQSFRMMCDGLPLAEFEAMQKQPGSVKEGLRRRAEMLARDVPARAGPSGHKARVSEDTASDCTIRASDGPARRQHLNGGGKNAGAGPSDHRRSGSGPFGERAMLRKELEITKRDLVDRENEIKQLEFDLDSEKELRFWAEIERDNATRELEELRWAHSEASSEQAEDDANIRQQQQTPTKRKTVDKKMLLQLIDETILKPAQQSRQAGRFS